MKAHQSPLGKSDVWLTPPEILSALGEFDTDPCAAGEPFPTNIGKAHNYTEGGLEKPWIGRVWCNPPFNRYERPKWMQKMARHGDGIMLIPAATETRAFYQTVWSRADAVCFVKGRPYFLTECGQRATANCGCAIALVAFGFNNTSSLLRSDLGKTVTLKN